MTSISPLENILKKGVFGDYEGKQEDKLIKIEEIKNLFIFQIVQYKNSSLKIKDLKFDGLTLPEETMKTNYNKDSRLLWCGPKNWLLISSKKDLIKNIQLSFKEDEFAVTDLSHSRAVIEVEGEYVKEVLKKGCPVNFNELKTNNCVNSIFNGIAVTIDLINEKPDKVRLFILRSFSESFYYSITDCCLEYGYKAV
tara:strand:- start:478 stop:1065 length:588 start_codon:yes stop_codon:yes gene_type:complete